MSHQQRLNLHSNGREESVGRPRIVQENGSPSPPTVTFHFPKTMFFFSSFETVLSELTRVSVLCCFVGQEQEGVRGPVVLDGAASQREQVARLRQGESLSQRTLSPSQSTHCAQLQPHLRLRFLTWSFVSFT